MAAQRLRVGLVGAGIGRQHALAYATLPDRFELVAVCDLNLDRGRALADEVGAHTVTDDFAALCRTPSLDMIDICTPPVLHVEQALAALAAGKHVVLEKPVAGSLRDVDALIEAEARAGRRVLPVFQYRYGHGYQKLKRLVDDGVTGPCYLATVETMWRRGPEYYAVPWRGRWASELGGALIGHAIHAHDMLTHLLGPPRTVYARLATRVNPIETEDCAVVALEWPDGALGTLAVTLGSAAEITRHRFAFAHLTAESNTRPYTSSGDPWSFTGTTSENAAGIDAALATHESRPEGYAGLFLRLHEALTAGAALPVTLAEARHSIELATAIYASGRSGLPETLPLDAQHPLYAGWQP